MLKITILLLLFCNSLIYIGCPWDKKETTLVGTSSDNDTNTPTPIIITSPTNLAVSGTSYNTITLSWTDNSINEDGFEIERYINENTYELIANAGVNSTSYSDTGVIVFNIYHYRIRAFKNSGEKSAYSNEISSIPLMPLWTTGTIGDQHTIALANNGTLWGWGANWTGCYQLGLGSGGNKNIPTQIGTGTDWIAVAASFGGNHTIAKKADGTIWGWGGNSGGQLGLGYSNNNGVSTPQKIGTATDWSKITAGDAYTLAIKIGGTVWGCGYNEYGQLGLGNTINRNTLAKIGTASDWEGISAGDCHTLARKTNSTIWSWGNNWFGQLGLGDSDDTHRNTPTQIGTDSDWIDISGGAYHTIAQKIDKTIWSWGSNYLCQLGLGDLGHDKDRNTPTQIGTDSDWVKIKAGNRHNLALKTNGTMWSWGRNYWGELGLGDFYNRSNPVQIRIGSDMDWSEIIAGGSDPMGQEYTIAIKTNGSLWSWGGNNSGQLGFGDTVYRNIPTPLGVPKPPSSFIAKVISPSEINLSWIDNYSTATGFIIEKKVKKDGIYELIGSVNADINSYRDITTTAFASNLTYYYRVHAFNNYGNSIYAESSAMLSGDWSIIAAGGRHTIICKTNGTLWGLGYNGNGQLGVGDPNDRYSPSQIGTNSDWSSIAASQYHSVVCKTDRTMWTYGYNEYGQLGLGDTFNRTTPSQIGSDTNWSKIAVADFNSFAIKNTGTMWGWGSSYLLSLGDSDIRTTPTQIGTNSDWVNIFACYDHAMALKTNGTIWAWGNNDYGKLGLGDTADRDIPTKISIDSDWLIVAVSSQSTMAFKNNKTMWGWGRNALGELGLDNTENQYVPTQIGTDSDWFVISTTNFYPLAVSRAIKTNGTIWVWGYNEDGRLGLGDRINRYIPVLLGTDSDWHTVSSSWEHTIACKTNGTIWSWGYNEYGQLGLGDHTDRNIPTMVPLGD